MDPTLYCDHTSGREDLLDGLSRGALNYEDQHRLWSLLLHMVDHPEYFRPTDVLAYQCVPGEDDTLIITWRCSVCNHGHTDIVELELEEVN